MLPRSSVSSRLSLLLAASAALGAVACSDTMGPPVAVKLAFVTQPVSTVLNTSIPSVTVVVQEADGHTVTSATHPITLAIGNNPGGGTLSGTTTRPAINGIATFPALRIGSLGDGYTLTASSPSLTGATSIPFSILPGQPTRLVFLVQPAVVVAGAAIAPAIAVAVQDGLGNQITGATTLVTLGIATNPAGGFLSGSTTVQAVNGVATFANLSINRSGAGYTLSAVAPPLTAATSNPFSVAAGPASRVGFTVQPSTTAPGAVMTPGVAVAVQDQLGNTVTSATHSITVAIGANPASATLSGTTTVSAVSGVAVFPNLSLNNPGTGFTLNAAAASLTPSSSVSFDIRQPLVFSSIAAGYFHSCGLTTGGAAYCWGSNAGGQLGGAVVDHSTLPVAVSGGLVFSRISAGRDHVCGSTAAGLGYCWGANFLGAGTVGGSSSPLAVAGGLTFARVRAGYSHSCGVAGNGAGYCWGDNGFGQLGTGTGSVGSIVPAAVAGSLSFADISPGREFSCGLTTAGAAYCWGDNTNGNLGDGTTTLRHIPVPVSAGPLTFAVVGAGGFHACALTPAGEAYCWGLNSSGQLGTPGSTSLVPRAVAGGLVFVALSVGNRHNCGLTAAGVAWCWGDNSTGMLGTGTATLTNVPVAVAGGHTFATISAGRFHTCGVTVAGAGYCWGSGGALGDGTVDQRLLPTRVF